MALGAASTGGDVVAAGVAVVEGVGAVDGVAVLDGVAVFDGVVLTFGDALGAGAARSWRNSSSLAVSAGVLPSSFLIVGSAPSFSSSCAAVTLSQWWRAVPPPFQLF